MAAGSAHGAAWQDGARRALEYALAASLALHVLALLSFPSLPSLSMRPAPPEPPLEARLTPLQPAEPPKPPPPPAPVPTPVEPKPIEPKPTEQKAVEPKRRAPARPAQEEPPPAAEPAPLPAPAPAPAPAPVAAPPPPRAQPSVSAARPPAPPAPRAAARPDAASLAARYRSAIMLQAARYKRYPRFARDNGWEGRVEVRLAIGADGAVASIGAAGGSGYAILDRQALEMVRSAQRATTIPEGLRGKPFSVDIPVIFSLRDAEG